jgi:hypothetical protein
MRATTILKSPSGKGCVRVSWAGASEEMGTIGATITRREIIATDRPFGGGLPARDAVRYNPGMVRLNVLPTPKPGGPRLPPWLKKRLPTGDILLHTRDIVERSGVATVCEEAHCPNLIECWSKRHATFMILGDKCTRRCLFCAVDTARLHHRRGAR